MKKLFTSLLFIVLALATSAQIVSINSVTGEGATGLPISNGVTVTVTGIVHGVNLRASSTGLSFTIINNTHGIACFTSPNTYGYTVTEGDSVVVTGEIGQYNGLTQIYLDTIIDISGGHTLTNPWITRVLDESQESRMTKIKYLTMPTPSQWSAAGSGFTVDVTDGINTYDMRIDNDVDLFGMSAPTGVFHLTGIGGQFDLTSPYFEYYQLLPRYAADIESIPFYDISSVSNEDGNGEPDQMGSACMLSGVVYGVNTRASETGISFTIRDNTGGIVCYNGGEKFGYNVSEGDSVVVGGEITHFNGLTELYLDTIFPVISTGHTLKNPTLVTTLNESTEADLVKINNVSLVTPSQWTGNGSGFNVDLTDGSNTYEAWIDNDCSLYSTSAPTGSFNLTGIGAQFDDSSPYTSFYQIQPRYISDLVTPGGNTASTITVSACNTYASPSGKTFTNTNTYFDTILNAANFDSIITIILSVHNSTTSTINPTTCVSYTSPSGKVFTASNSYLDTIPNNNNCDSIITINLSITTSTFGSITTSACDSYTSPSGKVFISSNTYSDTITNGSCDSIITIDLTINPTPTIVASGTANTCMGQSVIIIATGGSDYIWDNGLGTNPIVTVSPTATTTYTVSGTSGGCSSTDQVTITVSGSPAPTIVASANDTIFCGSGTVILSASGGTSYDWDNGLGAGSSVSSTVLTTTTFTVTGTDGTCDNSDIITITVYDNPNPPIIDNSGTLETGVYTSYQWYINGTAISDATNQTFVYSSDGSYTVEVMDANGCINSSTALVIGSTGISDNEINILNVSPNPSTNFIQVFGDVLVDQVSVKILDITGKELKYLSNVKIKESISITEFKNGVYILEITQGKEKYFHKIVKN